jgi:predicted metal-dependent peptidase
MKLEPLLKQKLSASLLRITNKSAFFAALALHAHLEASEEIPTAATDGSTVYVNPAFWESLTAGEQDGVLLHEVLHAALLHVSRRAGRDPKLWNVAADIVVNGIIVKEGWALPENRIRDTRSEHLAVEEAYEKLLKDANLQPPPDADLLDAAPGDASSQAAGIGKEREDSRSREASDGFWKNALEQAQMVARMNRVGDVPAGILRELKSASKPQLDWRSYLWRYLTQTPTDFTSFDRRFVGRGVYLDTIDGESVRVMVCVDTSGSVDDAELGTFLGEVRSILRAYPHLECDLYFADAQVHGPFPLKGGAVLPKAIGGGGTDFRPFFARIASHRFLAHQAVAIYLTDGYGTFPERAPRYPVLWVVPPGGLDLERFPFGEAVRLLKTQATPYVASR